MKIALKVGSWTTFFSDVIYRYIRSDSFSHGWGGKGGVFEYQLKRRERPRYYRHYQGQELITLRDNQALRGRCACCSIQIFISQRACILNQSKCTFRSMELLRQRVRMSQRQRQEFGKLFFIKKPVYSLWNELHLWCKISAFSFDLLILIRLWKYFFRGGGVRHTVRS